MLTVIGSDGTGKGLVVLCLLLLIVVVAAEFLTD